MGGLLKEKRVVESSINPTWLNRRLLKIILIHPFSIRAIVYECILLGTVTDAHFQLCAESGNDRIFLLSFMELN